VRAIRGGPEVLFLAGLLSLTAEGCSLSHSVSGPPSLPILAVVNDPYSGVDWSSVERHKSALHTHTLQSDGHQMPREVVVAYRRMGFTVVALTDHDYFRPNFQIRTGTLPEEAASPYPEPAGVPTDFPLNTTWPWSKFGTPAPPELGMVGIEGAELSRGHHMGSYFNSYGAPAGVEAEDDQIWAVGERGGLTILFHPGVSPRRPVEWYEERFRLHPPERLIGLEITNSPRAREAYDESLWDQLLARLLPERTVWGVGTDDMHDLRSVPESHTTLLLEEFSETGVREALISGRFLFHKSTRRLDFLEGHTLSDPFPGIESIEVDNVAGAIRVRAVRYDEILWISAPSSLELRSELKQSDPPGAAGQVVARGESIRFREVDGVAGYLRIEMRRVLGGDTYRTFTNPLVLGSPRGPEPSGSGDGPQ
jgi:hypothetical protein